MNERARPGAGLRRQYLRWYHGLINVAYLLLLDGLIVAWLWYGVRLLPFAAFVAVAVLASVIHQRLLSEWFHEATHWNLLPDRHWNDRVTDLLVGVFFGIRVRSNRPGHFKHHATDRFFVPGDPDTAASAAASGKELARGMLLDLCGYNAIRVFLGRAGPADQGTGGPGPDWSWLAFLVVLHGTGFAVTALAGRIEIYPIYFGTLLTLYPLVNRFRLYGQHATQRADGSIGLVGSGASRTFHAGPLEQLLLNSAVIMYHHEHHALPSLPYRALRAIAERSEDPNVNGQSCFRMAAAVLAGLR